MSEERERLNQPASEVETPERALFYVSGRDIYHRPVTRTKADGTKATIMGFRVCTVDEWVNPDLVRGRLEAGAFADGLAASLELSTAVLIAERDILHKSAVNSSGQINDPEAKGYLDRLDALIEENESMLGQAAACLKAPSQRHAPGGEDE